MRNINSSKLTKQTILDKISQVTIFATYLGLSVETVQHCINSGELICNPLRIDNHPTAGFKYNSKGKLKFKDFGNDGFWGDCFDVVALIMSNMYNKSYDISNKKDFIKVLYHISFTFKDIFYGKEKDENFINSINKAIINIKSKKPIIELVIRNWNSYDEEYWRQFGVSIKYLNINFIYPIDQYYINRKVNPEPKYYYNPNDPCYGYLLGKDSSGINNIKIYFPNRNKGCTRFITNCNHLEGIYNLNKDNYDIIVITKSTKDRVSIGCNLQRMMSLYGEFIINKIGVINIPHETYHLKQNEYDWLISKLSNNGKLISLMDNDRTGKIEALWLERNFNIIPILIPKYLKAKDFAELVSLNSIKEIYDITKIAINYIVNYERKDNKLTWNKKESNDVPY